MPEKKQFAMKDFNKHAVGFALSGLATGWLVFSATLFAAIIFICYRYTICIEPNALL